MLLLSKQKLRHVSVCRENSYLSFKKLSAKFWVFQFKTNWEQIAFSNLPLNNLSPICLGAGIEFQVDKVPSAATTSGYYKEEPKPNRFLYMDIHLCFSDLSLIGFGRVPVNRPSQDVGDDRFFVYFLKIFLPT